MDHFAPSFCSAQDGDAIHVDLLALPPRDELEALWRDLEQRADRHFFLSWTWIGVWLDTIDRRPELLIARRHGRVVGLGLLLGLMKTRHRVMPIRTLYLNQTGDDDQDVVTIEYNDILADRHHERPVRDACLRFLIAQGEVGGQQAGEVILGGIDGALQDQVEALGRPVHERARAGSAYVDLATLRRDGKGFVDALKPSTARRIRRSLVLYRERGALDLHRAATVDEALAFFSEAGAMHQARWTARGRPGAFAFPFFTEFHRRLIPAALPQGKVELVLIAAGGVPIGYLYNFLDRGRVYYYFSGFRFEDDNRLKPGLVAHALCIESHLAGPMDVYDFMGGDQRYKRELGQAGPDIVTLAVQRPNWMLAAERPLRRLKQVVGAALPGR